MNNDHVNSLHRYIELASQSYEICEQLSKFQLLTISTSPEIGEIVSRNGITNSQLVKFASYCSFQMEQLGFFKIKTDTHIHQLVFAIAKHTPSCASVAGYSFYFCLLREEEEFGLATTHIQVHQLDHNLD